VSVLLCLYLLKQKALQVINVSRLLTVQLWWKAAHSGKSTGLRSTLLGAKFSASINSGMWENMKGTLLSLALFTALALVQSIYKWEEIWNNSPTLDKVLNPFIHRLHRFDGIWKVKEQVKWAWHVNGKSLFWVWYAFACLVQRISVTNFKTSILLQIMRWTFRCIDRLSMSSWVTNCQKCSFFWPTFYVHYLTSFTVLCCLYYRSKWTH